MDLLKIKYPIIQAGMAGGITTADLVSAVAEQGGLGTIGAGYMDDKTLKHIIKEVKEQTNQPFAVNLFAADLAAQSDEIFATQKHLNQIRQELGMDHGKSQVIVTDHLEAKIDVIIEENIPIVSTAFGVLPTSIIKKLKDKNIRLLGMATNVSEGEQLVQAGYDAIVAQGTEAGGHRGTFDIRKYPEGCNIELLSLVRQFLTKFSVPIIAAGGIYARSQVKALQEMGVSAVQIGTRFLLAKEAGTNKAYRKALIQATSEDTVITKVFSGRPARAIQNEMIQHINQWRTPIQPFPIQNALTKDIRTYAKEQENSNYQSLWAGTGVGNLKKEETVSEIITDLFPDKEKSK